MKNSISLKVILDSFDRSAFSIISLASFGLLFSQNFIYALILEKEAFGKIFLVVTLYSLVSYLSVFGLDNTLFKFYHSNEFENKNSLKKHIFILWLAQSVVLTFLLALIGYLVVEFSNSNQFCFGSDFLLLLIAGILSSFFSIFQQFFLAEKSKILFALFSLGVKLVLLILNLISILIFGPNLKYFVLSYFLGVIILFLSSFWFLNGFIRSPIQKNILIKIFHFSWPLSINSLISVSFTNGYRVLISAIIPFGQFAIYGIASQISTAYYIGMTSLLFHYNSNAYSILNSHKELRFLRYYIQKCITYGTYGIILSIIVSLIIFKFLKNGEYLDGINILPILLLGQFLFLLYSHEYILLSFYNKTKYITFSTLLGIVVILCSYWYLISNWGIVGAALATLVGYLTQYLVAINFRLRMDK